MVEAMKLPSLAKQESLSFHLGSENQSTQFRRDLERGNFEDVKIWRKDVKESKKAKEELEHCENVFSMMEGPVKWREIQKTLRWLEEEVFASNKSILRKCYKWKTWKKRSELLELNENSKFSTSKRNLGRRRLKKKRKSPIDLFENRVRDLINSTKSNIYSKRNKKLRAERKYKHKFRENRWKNKENRRKSLKRKIKFRYTQKLFHPKNMKIFSSSNSTILKPNGGLSHSSTLFDVARKNEGSSQCRNPEVNSKDSPLRATSNCLPNARATGDKSIKSLEKWSKGWKKFSEGRSKAEARIPKGKPWPRFVYHRVSSNFLHPEVKDRNHHSSAYLAISVAASNDSDSSYKKENSKF